MWRAASRLSSINYEMGNQYLKFTYRLQLVLVKTLYDLNMQLGLEDMEGICGINQKIPGSFKLLSNMFSSVSGKFIRIYESTTFHFLLYPSLSQ